MLIFGITVIHCDFVKFTTNTNKYYMTQDYKVVEFIIWNISSTNINR